MQIRGVCSVPWYRRYIYALKVEGSLKIKGCRICVARGGRPAADRRTARSPSMRGRCVHRKADVPILEHYASVVARVDANQGLDEVWAAIDKATDKANY